MRKAQIYIKKHEKTLKNRKHEKTEKGGGYCPPTVYPPQKGCKNITGVVAGSDRIRKDVPAFWSSCIKGNCTCGDPVTALRKPHVLNLRVIMSLL